MEIKQDMLQAISKGLKDRDGDQPPIHVTWAVASLAAGDGVPAILRGRREDLDAGGTAWYALAVTGGVIVTVIASSATPNWNVATKATDGTRQKPAALDARSRRIRDISSLEVTETIGSGSWNDLTRWSASWRIHFADGGDPFDIHPDMAGESDEIARTLGSGLK